MVAKISAAKSSLEAIIWAKSSYSNPCGSCVELCSLSEGMVAVRDSKHRSGAVLISPRNEMVAFVKKVKMGEFDSRSSDA